MNICQKIGGEGLDKIQSQNDRNTRGQNLEQLAVTFSDVDLKN